MVNTKTPELIGSEKMNFKFHFFYFLFNIMNESSDSIRGGDRNNVMAYQASLDMLYDGLIGYVDKKQIINLKQVNEIQKELENDVEQMYLTRNQELVFRYYLKLKKYQRYLLENVRNTGLIPAKPVTMISGEGTEDETNDISEFPNPVDKTEELEIAKPLTKEEKKKIKDENKAPFFQIDDNIEDDELYDDED